MVNNALIENIETKSLHFKFSDDIPCPLSRVVIQFEIILSQNKKILLDLRSFDFPGVTHIQKTLSLWKLVCKF